MAQIEESCFRNPLTRGASTVLLGVGALYGFGLAAADVVEGTAATVEWAATGDDDSTREVVRTVGEHTSGILPLPEEEPMSALPLAIIPELIGVLSARAFFRRIA